MKKVLSLILGCAMSFCIVTGLVGCGSDDGPEAGQTRITFWGAVNQYDRDATQEMVDAYNAGQGKLDGVYVKYASKGREYGNNLSTTLSSSRSQVDVICITDKNIKNYVLQGFLVNLQDYIDDETKYTKDADGNQVFSLDNYDAKVVDRWRLDKETRIADSDSDLYAMPQMAEPTFIYYNEGYFESANINIISVAEDDLEAYNAANNAHYMPHGYAEYATAPQSGLKSSTNLRGETVYKVFNNQIAMNTTELVTLSKYFSSAHNINLSKEFPKCEFGFLNEWWFSFGWSVGGDCMNWDETSGQYKFTLGNENPNYLVTENTTVNDHEYHAGDILNYMDKTYVAENSVSNDALYKLPSQYEAFRTFVQLSQETGKNVDSATKGLEISPSPSDLATTSKESYFTSGRVAMVCLDTSALNSVSKVMGNQKWDIAPCNIYREFKGGDVAPDGDLKVIGKTYTEGEYTGEAKIVNDTVIKGYESASSINYGYAIPANSSNKEAAYKFMQWCCSVNGQKYIAKSNMGVPTDKTYAFSEEYLNASTNLCKNYVIMSKANAYCDIGDWSYVEDGKWITAWSNTLNTDVRNGVMDLDTFFNQYQSATDTLLAAYTIRIAGK